MSFSSRAGRTRLAGTIPLVTATLLTLFSATTVSADSPDNSRGNDSRVLPPEARVAGKSIGQWTGLWWRAALTSLDFPFPAGGSQPGSLGDAGGPVFFAVVSPGPGATTFTYSVPRGQYVLLPLYTYSWAIQTNADPCSDYECARSLADQFVGEVASLSVRIDGETVRQLSRHYAATPGFFTANVPVDGWWAGGDPAYAGLWYGVSSGYWLMLAPLAPGKHVISISVEAPYSSVCADGSDSCDVPAPGPAELSTTRLVIDVSRKGRAAP